MMNKRSPLNEKETLELAVELVRTAPPEHPFTALVDVHAVEGRYVSRSLSFWIVVF